MAKGTIQKGFRGLDKRVAARHAREAPAEVWCNECDQPSVTLFNGEAKCAKHAYRDALSEIAHQYHSVDMDPTHAEEFADCNEVFCTDARRVLEVA